VLRKHNGVRPRVATQGKPPQNQKNRQVKM
jgi:hypothetical protein